MSRASGFGPDIMIENDVILVNRGAVAEQFVAQELLAYADPYTKAEHELFWWEREKHGSSAEVDFIISKGTTLFPIEVKAGTIGKLRSLKIFMGEKKAALGVRISQQPLSLEDSILSLPLYLIEQLPKLLS
jgi:hypothetical protein